MEEKIAASVTWDEIDLAESHLVSGLFEEAATLASSILTRLHDNRNIYTEDEIQLHEMMESSAMVLVQSYRETRRTSDLLNELECYFGSVTKIPVQVVLTSACVQVSGGNPSKVRDFLEDFLAKWQLDDERYYILSSSDLQKNGVAVSSMHSTLEVDQYLKVVEFYALTLMGVVLSDVDHAVSWVEKAQLPEKGRQDLLRRLFSLYPLKSPSSTHGAVSVSTDEEPESHPLSLKEVKQAEKTVKNTSIQSLRGVVHTKRSIWKSLRNMARRSCISVIASKGKIFVGCLIFLICYYIQKKRETIKRIKHVARKPKPKQKAEPVKGTTLRKRKGKTVQFDSGESDNSFEGDFSGDSSNCDTDVDFNPEEEDREDSGAREQEFMLGDVGFVNEGRRTDVPDVDAGGVEDEIYYDSDELRSVHGSDDENEDHYPTFNPSGDLKGQVVLKKGLKFSDITVLRRAIQTHAIQNHYDYYLLHNNAKKLTAYCKNRCGCLWDSQHGIIEKCVCKGNYKCNFRIYALRMKGSTDLQIKTCKLEHHCGYQDVNSKATSSFLAEHFLDLWRADPSLSLKSFVNIVQRELGLKIGYQKAWTARARAKLMIYGDAAEEYGRVFDYGHALLKYNPGSTVIITTEGQETSTPVFQRMYICLAACKAGFLSGCRPLVGVDGCHLKGAYPGMLLVAVSKDGNNMIYPLAWAVVEVENTETWTWFLSLLVQDINKPDGEELTIMSDRQKGLLEAISECLPKAEVRFCVRHIWASFKLHFSGQAFKEYFWHAARTCNVNVFNGQMQIIKMLSDEAFQYLEAIPSEHWARHKFQTFSKSNMLLNNLCETFNGVLRGARDKPIISCMEWVRKYVMRRNFEKLQSLEKVRGRFMPYVAQVLK